MFEKAVRWVTAQVPLEVGAELDTTELAGSRAGPQAERDQGPSRRAGQLPADHDSTTRCRQDALTDHPSGRALDLMIPNYKSASGKALGQKVAAWAKANARDLGINYVIWNQHIWNIRARQGRLALHGRPRRRFGQPPESRAHHRVRRRLRPALEKLKIGQAFADHGNANDQQQHGHDRGIVLDQPAT